MNTEHLIKMLEHIVRNMGYATSEAQQVDLVAGHIQKFWEMRMIEAVLQDPDCQQSLSPIGKAVIEKLAANAAA